MIHSNLPDDEQQSLHEFCDFVESSPMTPSAKTESQILHSVEADLSPSQWLVFGKLFAIEAVTGLATLFVCPQFGLGFGGHNELLHTLHETVDPFTFYLVCGLIFVIAGAAISGLSLNRDELRIIQQSKYIYYPLYALTAYFIFTLFGAEILLISLIPWIVGAVIGNAFGFSLGSRMRFAPIATH